MWIHLPSTCCPSAPGTAASTSELTLPQAERLASSATLSAKRSLPRYWRLAWRKKSWLRLLSGPTCEHSTADLGVASWISSLAAIRASRSVTPACALASKMSDIYGPTSLASLARLCPASSSSRMSPDTSLSDSMLFAPTSSASATELRLDYSRRLKLAQAIAANGSSSLAWPTPNCPSMRDNEDTATRECGRHQYDLKRAAIQWPTATAGDAKASGSACYPKTSTHQPGTTLTDATERVMRWPTPRAEDAASCGQHPGAMDALNKTAEHWPTPRTITGGGESAARKQELGRMNSGGGDLQAAAMQWPTPAGSMTAGEDLRATWKPGEKPTREDGKVLQTALTTCTQIWASSPPAPASEPDGPTSSPTDPTSRPRLNVNFVEWLMGVPHGWTDFAPLGTEWCRWSRRMRSRLSGLVSSMAKENDR